MELQGLTHRAAALLVAALVALALGFTPASAGAFGSPTASPFGGSSTAGGVVKASLTARGRSSTTASTATDPNTPVLVTSSSTPPPGYRLSAIQVQRIADRVQRVRDVVRRHRGSYAAQYTKGPGRWQVSWFTRAQKEIAQVYVDDATGKVTEAWTGFQVAWSMARGYPGAFGRQASSWYVWVPLCGLFLAPFLPRLRRGRRARGRTAGGWSLLHLDLVVLLAFSISLAFFNNALIGISVPLVYPFLTYLLIRMLLLARGKGSSGEPLALLVPASWLAIAVVFLVGFRVGLNLTNSNVIDVGYAGVIGADRVVHGKPLYGGWPRDNAQGDTYGPVNYYAYVPARQIFGWSGRWDDLPASHAAAIAFDLLTLIALFFLGRRIRGPTLGIVLAYAWVSYPFTLYALNSNSNDTLVALLVVLALLALSSAPARGVATALAGLTKFAPLALGPLFLRGTGARVGKRAIALYTLAFGMTALAVMGPVLLDGNLSTFWNHTISYQAARPSPFSIWGLWGGLELEQRVVQIAGVLVAVGVAFVPRTRTPVQVASLAAVVLIALELGVTHWFYLYIVWFFPLVMVAVLGRYPERVGQSGAWL